MKAILTRFLALGSISLLVLASCKKNDPVVTTNPKTAGQLTVNTTDLPLDKTMLADTTKVVTFKVSTPQYGYSASVTNTLEIDADGDNWKKPTTITLANKINTAGFSTADFNNMVLKLNLPAGVASKINVRVQHILSADVSSYSNVVSLIVTPFNLTSWIYATGIFASWQNPGPLEDSLVSATGNGVYTGILHFTNPAGDGDNEFLLLPKKGDWSHKYATKDAQGTTSSTLALDASNNFYAQSAQGYYIVTANLNAGTITFQASDYYSVTGNEVVGGDWGVDQFMKFVNDGNNNWVTTLSMMHVDNGGFKIRQDAQWTNSWGTSATSGVLTDASGGNLDVTDAKATTYTTTFNMAPTAYGSAPVTLAPYTLVKQ
jgi:hypothetical protein